jgi:hypothetical protein
LEESNERDKELANIRREIATHQVLVHPHIIRLFGYHFVP